MIKAVSCLIISIIGIHCFSQPERPAVFLSQIEMTPSGGQPYDQFYWFNSNKASLTKTAVVFPATGSYRIDISAYKTAGKPIVNVLIDGTSQGSITVDSTSIYIFSLFIKNISSGSHKIALQLSNFNSGKNHVRIGLVYFTQTNRRNP